MSVVELRPRVGSRGRALTQPGFVDRGGPIAASAEAEAFTVEHFRGWAASLVLDSWEPWVLEPFQEAFVADVFSGVQTAWLVVPEGNGKTTLIAGLVLYHCQFMPQATVAVAASSREQAEILYRQAEGFIYRSDSIRELFRPLEGMRRIRCDGMGSRMQVLAADDKTGDGIIATLCVVDELHRHKDLRLYRTWLGKFRKRRGQVLVISTAGEPGSEFEEAREATRQAAPDVRREETFVRAASAQFVLHEWAVPEDGDVEDMGLVARANPFSGVTVEDLAEKRALPGMTLAHWRRFTCNLPTRSDMAAITEAEWYGAVADEEIPAGVPVWAGLDVGWKWDTTALVPLWWRDDEFRLLGPAVVLEPPRDHTMLDPNLVKRALLELHERNPIHTLVMDMSDARDIADWAATEVGVTVIDRPQSPLFQAEEYDRFMEALRQGWLWHSGDRELARHAMNAVARLLPRGDAMFDRPAQNRRSAAQDLRVIDALKAAAMVHATAATLPAPVAARRWVPL